eukprot:gnl/Chilomastix_cuspidata/3176.p1 GENE.gnl/Chilomastix_cuspidata/3176~~gnl/Chilomastix_cuspidata/3176.p1  ORF type:complete len:699 (+),score=311.51 gnl/Chilomastix_cuspidata/3176:465-2561(+)
MEAASAARSWESLRLLIAAEVLEVVTSKLKFSKMTPVQAATIPIFAKNTDVCVQAETGSGKTLAYLVPLFQQLFTIKDKLSENELAGLVLCPTRELAQQVFEVSTTFSDSLGIPTLLLVGGVSNERQEEALRTSGRIVIGTPGRVLDAFRSAPRYVTRRAQVMVLDEADRLLDLGFAQAIASILALIPKQRRSGLFSATQTTSLRGLIHAGLRSPTRIAVDGASTEVAKMDPTLVDRSVQDQSALPEALDCRYLFVPEDRRIPVALALLTARPHRFTLVFGLTCAYCEYIAHAFRSLRALRGRNVILLHGKLKAAQRRSVFRQAAAGGPGTILVATDLAARGLDIEQVRMVVQLDMPQDPDTFVHRVGRTARIGRAGLAVAMVAPHEDDSIALMASKGVRQTQLLPENDPFEPRLAWSHGLPCPRDEAGAPLEYPRDCIPTDPEEHRDWADACRAHSALLRDARKVVKKEERELKKLERSFRGGAGGDALKAAISRRREKVLQDAAGRIRRAEQTFQDLLAAANPARREVAMFDYATVRALRDAAKRDRAVFEQSQIAFITWIRGYTEHRAALVFDIRRVPLGALATGLGVLRLPKMRELQHRHVQFRADRSVDLAQLPYRNAGKEAARQARRQEKLKELEERRAAPRAPAPKKKPAEPRRRAVAGEDDDFHAEALLYRKFKRGKISKKEFERLSARL